MISASARAVGNSRFPERAQKAISLALIEAVDNAIFHAHHRKRRMPIDVVLIVNRSYIRAEVGDRGSGLNGEPSEPPKGMKTTGRGLYVMRSAVGSVESLKMKNRHWMRMTYYL